jgi:hypothetical protein
MRERGETLFYRNIFRPLIFCKLKKVNGKFGILGRNTQTVVDITRIPPH